MAFNPSGPNPWLKYNRAAEEGTLPQYPQDKNYPVKLAYPDWWPAMREFAARPTEGQPYWTPRRIGRYYNALQSVPYAANVPTWIDAPKIATAYKMLSDSRQSDWQTWEDNLDIDPVIKQYVSDWAPPPLEAIPQWEQDDFQAVSDAVKTDNGPIGEWTYYGIDYETWQKLPEWKKWANRGLRSMGGQMLQQSINLGIAGASVAGVPGAAVGLGAGALMGYLGNEENKRAMRMGADYKPGATYYVMGALNFLFTQAQQGMAFKQQISNSIRDAETYGSLGEILKDIPAAWEAGEGYYSMLPYEVGSVFGKDGKVRVINIAGEDYFVEGAGKGVSGSGTALAEIRRMLADGKLSPAQVREYTIQKYSGFAGEMTDLLAGYVLDPLDLIGPVTSGIIGNVADAKGNKPLAKSFLAPTGADDLLTGYRRYRQELRQMPNDDLRKMSNITQWFAGIDEQGRDQSLRREAGGPLGKFVDKMVGTSAQGRADESLHQFVDGLSIVMDMEKGNVDGMYRIAQAMATTPGNAVDAVANSKVKINVGGVPTDTRLPNWSLSTEAQVVPLMMKDQMPKVKDHYDLYRNTRPQANLLTRISEALGEDVYKLISDLHGTPEKPPKTDYDGVMKRIKALADEGNKPAADFIKNTEGLKDLDNAALKKAADLFSGESGAAFDGNMWGVQLLHLLSEGAEKWAVDWFNIKPSGWAIRLGEVVKKMQSMMLLGLNPTYLANNAINNVVTMAWDGLFSSMSKKQQNEWMRRYGMTTQIKKGMGGAEIGEVDTGVIPGTETGKGAYQLGRHLRDATRAKDGMQKAQDLLKGGDKFMLAAALSQKMERWSSEIATFKGIKEYWDGAWRAGVGFDKMPADLRLVLDGVQPGLADKVEKAIARGLNKAEIEKEVFTRLEVPSLRDVMTPEELRMMTSFPGLMDEIDKGMRDATTNEERTVVFNKAIEGVQKKLKEDMARKAVVFVHQAAAKVQTEGYAGAFDILDTLVPERHEFWQQHLQHMDDVAIRAEELVGMERANLWREELARADRDWKEFADAEGYKWLGIFEGLGAEKTSNTGTMVERNLLDIHSDWETFYNTRRMLMDEYMGYVDNTDFTGMSKEEGRALRSAKWGEINEKLNKAYSESVMIEDILQSELDRLFIRQYGQQFGAEAANAAIQWRDEQQKVRRTMVQAQLLWRTGSIPENILKAYGKLLPEATIEKILLLNGGEPIYKMMVGERDKANQKFYREIYRPLLGDMMKAKTVEKPKAGKPKVEKPKVEKKVAKPKEPEQSPVWKYIAEVKPELAGLDESGRPTQDAKLNVIKWLRKWSTEARAKNVKKWAEVTPALVHEAWMNEQYSLTHQPEVTAEPVVETVPVETVPVDTVPVETAPVEEPAPVTETVTEAPAEPVQEVSTEPVNVKKLGIELDSGVTGSTKKEISEFLARSGAAHIQTRKEFISAYKKELPDTILSNEQLTQMHHENIKEALGLGIQVPPEVLADYPDLAAQFPTDADLTTSLAEEAKLTEGLTPEAAAQVEEAQHIEAAREQVIQQAETMRQNVEEIMRLAPPKEVNGEIFRDYIHQVMSDKYPDKPNHAAHRADAIWTVIDRIATTLAKEKGITKDEWYNNFVLSRGGDRIWGNNALYRGGDQNTLQALHNLSFDDLLEADRLGGMPVPSFAILKKGQQFTDFGSVTLVGRRSLIDPGASGYNRVYGADAYTPSRPSLLYNKPLMKDVRALDASMTHMKEFTKKYFNDGGEYKLWEAMTNYPNRSQAESALRSTSGKYQFLKEIGVEVEPVFKDKVLYRPFLSEGDAILEYYKSLDTKYDSWNMPVDVQSKLSELARESLLKELTDVYKDVDNAQSLIDKTVKDWFGTDGIIRANLLSTLLADLETRANPGKTIDEYATRQAFDNEIIKHQERFDAWVEDKLRIFGRPQIEVRGKKVPVTLENLVDAMTKRDPRSSQENVLFQTTARTRAALTKRFKSIAEIHKLEDRLVSKAEFEEWKKSGGEADQLVDTYTTYLPSHDNNQFIDYDNKRSILLEAAQTGRISQESIRSLLEARGYKNPSDVAVEAAHKYLTILDNAPTEYFEAKPQRAVGFDELAGAVVPDDAPQEVFDALNRRGVEYKTYKANDATSRQEAVQSFYDREGVLFRTDPEQFYARLDRLEYQRTDDSIDYTVHFKDKSSTGDTLTYAEAREVLGENITAQILAGEDAGIIKGEQLRTLTPGGYSVRGTSGATYWLDNGKAVMHAFSRADIADVMHEYIHAITPLLPEKDLRTIERWYAKEYGRELNADWFDKTYPDVDAFEKLARAFERYMTEGPTGFTGEIVQAFENIKAWMLDIYKSLTHADIDIRMNDEIRAMFDRWLGMEKVAAKEPWQMTRAEYIAMMDQLYGRQIGSRKGEWEGWVRTAVSSKKDVAPEIISEYNSYQPDVDSQIKPASSVDASLERYTSGMTPLAKGRITTALEKRLSVNRVMKSRKTIVEDWVRDGATVEPHPIDGRRLTTGDRFNDEKQLGKAAMDYAEFLIGERDKAPVPVAPPTPAEPAAPGVWDKRPVERAEKVGAWGWTKAQEKYIADAINGFVHEKLPQPVIDLFNSKGEVNDDLMGVFNNVSEDVVRHPFEINVPGAGTLRLNSLIAMNNIYYSLTGKPLFNEFKTSPRYPEGPTKLPNKGGVQDVDLALRIYGTAENAVAKLQAQMADLSLLAGVDTMKLSSLIMKLQEIIENQGKTAKDFNKHTGTTQPEAPQTLERIGDNLWFKDANGELYRASANSPMDTNGWPMGSRWEAPAHLADSRLEMLRKDQRHVVVQEARAAAPETEERPQTSRVFEPGEKVWYEAMGSGPNAGIKYEQGTVQAHYVKDHRVVVQTKDDGAMSFAPETIIAYKGGSLSRMPEPKTPGSAVPAFTTAEKTALANKIMDAANKLEAARTKVIADVKDIQAALEKRFEKKESDELAVSISVKGDNITITGRPVRRSIKGGDITVRKTVRGWVVENPDTSLEKFSPYGKDLDKVTEKAREVVKQVTDKAHGKVEPIQVTEAGMTVTIDSASQANFWYKQLTGKVIHGYEDIPTKNTVLYRIPTDNEGGPLPEPPAQAAPLGTADEVMGVPVEEMTMAGWNQHLRPALERAQNAILSQNSTKVDLDADLTPEAKAALRSYLGNVYSQMADVKMGATRWGESRRNAALLDYSKRTGIDNTILGIFPYQFWYTRTAINWALRVLNKPSILANYYRLMRMSQRKEQKDGYPRRLKGKVPIPMPWLPDWMGDNIYIDPWRQALPFLQLTRPFENAAEEKNQIARRTEQLIYDMVDSGEVTDEQAQEAVTNKSGAIYIKAKAQAEGESERDFQNPFDFAFSLSAPLLPISIAYNVATGRADRISQLPLTRLVQNLTAMTGIGGPRGVNLEGGIRKAAGLPAIDRFEDYRVDRELASMAAEGLIDANTAQQAMIDRSGEAFTEAQRRVSKQGVIRYLGSTLALDLFPEGEAKQRGLQDEFAAAYDAKAKGDKEAVNKFFDKYPEYSARLATFKEPEERLRAFLRGIVWEKYLALPKSQAKKFREAAGDVFTEAFLNSETRSYDSISTDTLSLWANTLGETPEKAGTAELPVDWLNSETAKQIDAYYNEKSRIFGEYDPNAEPNPNYSLWQNQYLAEHPNIVQYVIGETNALYGLPLDIQTYVYRYRAARDTRYPNIFDIQDRYFALTNSAQKKAYLKANPKLPEYWDWRKQMAANFPKAAAYIMSEESLAAEILDNDQVTYTSGGGSYRSNGSGGGTYTATYSDGRPAESYHPPYLTSSELSRFSRPLVLQLLALFYRNEGLMPGANREITAIWEQLGKPFGTLDDFIQYAVKPTLTQ